MYGGGGLMQTKEGGFYAPTHAWLDLVLSVSMVLTPLLTIIPLHYNCVPSGSDTLLCTYALQTPRSMNPVFYF